MLVSNRDDAFHYDARTSRLTLVQEVWEFTIIPFFNGKELAMLRPTCRWCDEQWQEFLKRNTFCVPEQVPTIDEAMRIGFNLAKQKVYLKEKPLVVVLSEGEHVVEGSWTDSFGDVYEKTLDITCSNISFIGQGKNKTTVHGGIGVSNKKNVTVKSLTLTHPNEFGLFVEGEEASVEMLGVSVIKCGGLGLRANSGASVKATQCEFSENGNLYQMGLNQGYGISINEGSKGIFTNCTIHHNGEDGVSANGEGTLVELRGEQTKIHHNKRDGMSAGSKATINIYIPSQMDLEACQVLFVHNHDEEGYDLSTSSGGKIQSQLSLSSLELTVIAENVTAAPAVEQNEEWSQEWDEELQSFFWINAATGESRRCRTPPTPEQDISFLVQEIIDTVLGLRCSGGCGIECSISEHYRPGHPNY